MRGIKGLATLVLCLIANGAAAQETYRLQPGDTLQIWVAQEPELGREIVIAPDGWLAFPLAGHIKGAGLSVSELETQLLDKLKHYFKDSPNLTVMLRPNAQHQQLIYITGEVVTPGEYPYRANMTVLHGVSVAGGLYRAALLAADQDRSVVVQREVEQSQKQLSEMKARIVRLEAELDGKTSLGTAEDLAKDPQLAQEQSLLNSRLESLTMEETAQQRSEELAERNTAALGEQVNTITTRIDLAKRRLQSISTLVAKGGAESSQQMAQEGVVAELEGQLSRLMSEVATAERLKIAETARYESLRQDRHTQLLVELNGTRRAEEEAEARLNDSTRILSIYDTNAAANSQRARRILGYRIVRSVDGQTQEIEATEMTPILPGDLLRVLYVEQSVSAQNAEPLSDSNPAASIEVTATTAR